MTTATNSSDKWFAISMGLIGIIIGYGAATFTHFTPTADTTPTQQVAQVPNAPSVPSAPSAPTATPPKTGVGPTEGKSNAPITVVEFTDFQCPYCGRHYTDTYPQIKKNYVDTGKVKYEIRMFPLTSIHPNAEIGAEAAMCADVQGKFWQMHDKLFTNQAAWSAEPDPTATLKGYASAIGLNASKFASCLTNHDTQARIQKDTADGTAAGIDGTPGFWIMGPNGKTQQVSGAYPYSTFQTAFDGML